MIVQLELAAGGSDAVLRGAVQALAEHNLAWYRQHPEAPGPERAGLRYVADEPGPLVRLYDAPALLRRGQGSCGSLAAAQWAYLMARGVRAWLIVREPRSALPVWHAVVRTRSGIWEPSSLRWAAAPGMEGTG